jgi:hypothetical protein
MKYGKIITAGSRIVTAATIIITAGSRIVTAATIIITAGRRILPCAFKNILNEYTVAFLVLIKRCVPYDRVVVFCL